MLITVHIISDRVAVLAAGLDPGAVKRIGHFACGDMQRPDAAAIVGAIEGCTGAECEVNVGKPDPIMLETVMDMLGNRDLLEGDMKAQWEKQREINNKRGECKKAVKSIEAIVAELDKMAEDSEADLAPFANTAKRELNNAKNAVAKAKVDDANKALATAEDAKKQAAAAQPAPEPEPEADAEGGEEEASE